VPTSAPPPPAAEGPGPSAPLVRVQELGVEVAVYVGGGTYPLSTLAGLRPGAVVALETEVGEPAVLAVEGRVIALGEIMVTRDEMLAVRVTRCLLGEDRPPALPSWLEQPSGETGSRLRSSGPLPPEAGLTSGMSP
jgi:hypothetical protein